MRHTFRDPWFAGVDGCKDGWIVVFLHPGGNEIRVRVVRRFAEILSRPERPSIVVVDMPIGLPKFSPMRGRAAEKEARDLQGMRMRRSSIFRVPSRAAIYAGNCKRTIPDDGLRYDNACKIARTTSADSKAFSRQGFYLFPKIVEIDQLLRKNKKLRQRTYEAHPEVAFWKLNNKKGLKYSKKKPKGVKLRRRLLSAAGLPSYVVNSKPPKGAGTDDLLDALVCAAVARRISRGVARSYPNPPHRDVHGLTMAIWA